MMSHLWVSFHSAESLIQSSGTRRDARGSIALRIPQNKVVLIFYYHLVILESRNFTTLHTSSLRIVILYFTNNKTLTFFV